MTKIDTALIDRIVQDLTALRATLALEPDLAPIEAEPDEAWIDTTAAASRFGLPIDTTRWLARDKGMGRKDGGRWLVNVSAMRCYMAKRE